MSGLSMIRSGKGQKDRVVPIGQRALAWIDKYVTDVRPLFVAEPDEGVLFLTSNGRGFQARSMLVNLVKRYFRAADIGKHGACHVFRHSVATWMLESGADVRFVQELLGHSDLSTTAVYTHVSIAKLQQIYHATHPAARPRPGPSTDPPTLTPLVSRELPAAALGDDDEEDPQPRPDDPAPA